MMYASVDFFVLRSFQNYSRLCHPPRHGWGQMWVNTKAASFLGLNCNPETFTTLKNRMCTFGGKYNNSALRIYHLRMVKLKSVQKSLPIMYISYISVQIVILFAT